MAYAPNSVHLPSDRKIAHWVAPIARAGYAAKGLVYLIIGGLAVRTAIAGGKAPDAAGALAWLRESTAAGWALKAVAIGLAAFVVWRLVQAIFDPEHQGVDGKRIALRLFRVVSAVIHGSLAVTAWQLSNGLRTEGRDEDHWAGVLLAQPMGRWLAFAIGAGIIGYGLYQIYRGWTADVERHMQFEGDGLRRPIVALARLGLVARGIVFSLVGWFLIQAARSFDADAAGGTAEALRALGNGALLGFVAAGLFAYGLYQLAEARYRRIG
ncbi:MAG TPA: DUF1206 domain-containing protein [Candidatus Saccharimonadia bacterium]|nr:DUF1206 domain-containing protein [Candidatus Saccharimonadia bacterium]